MAKQMATKQGVRVRGNDPCAFCGEQIAVTTTGLLRLARAWDFETAWDEQRQQWIPYHRICWQQLQYQRRGLYPGRGGV